MFYMQFIAKSRENYLKFELMAHRNYLNLSQPPLFETLIMFNMSIQRIYVTENM